MSDTRTSPRLSPRLNTVHEGNHEGEERDIEANADAEEQPLLTNDNENSAHTTVDQPNPSDLVAIDEPVISKEYEPIRTEKIEGIDPRTTKRRLDRHIDEQVPEIHLIGKISYGSDLINDSSEGAFCRWKMSVGKSWQHLGGDLVGQTQVAYVNTSVAENLTFEHPVDAHFACAGLQGWGAPRIAIQSFRYDYYGRRILNGYGFCHVPFTPGHHRLSVSLWRPLGSLEQEMKAFLLGETPALVNPDPVYESAWKDRCRLITTSGGKVVIEMFVMTRYWKEQGVVSGK